MLIPVKLIEDGSESDKYNIRVNIIPPGFTNFELSKFIPESQHFHIISQTPTCRFGESINIGSIGVFLASPPAAQITGSIQVMDKGYIFSV